MFASTYNATAALDGVRLEVLNLYMVKCVFSGRIDRVQVYVSGERVVPLI